MPIEQSRRAAVSLEETSAFCTQIALILNAGMPLHDGLEALSQSYGGARGGEAYADISQRVTEGGLLGEALKESGIFPKYMIEMATIGERTGKLELVCQSLAAHYRREAQVRSAVKSATTYPLVLMAMMACVIAVLTFKVVPIFEQALGGMGLSVGGGAGALMRLGMGVGKGVMIAVGAAAVLILISVILLRTRFRSQVLRALSRLFPPVKKLGERIFAARFASVMAMMLRSGFPIEEALQMTPAIVDDEVVRRRVEAVGRDVAGGRSFADALERSALFDGLSMRMICTGCVAGQADVSLAQVAGRYEEEVDEGISRLVSIIEPTLVALLSIVIGAILLSVMLPMAGVISSIV